MENFTPIPSLIGGALIGISATLLLLLHGRVAGISGILYNFLTPSTSSQERSWRALFLAGLLGVGAVWFAIQPAAFDSSISRSLPIVAIAGLLVGVGTRLGSGCTSGHGVCGMSRLAPRSMIATLTFTITGALSVLLAGGAS